MRKKLPKSINLLDTVNAPGDTFTIFYEWTFTIGKYLLIFVQIIVIVVFIMRLTLDKINNDLTKDINSQVDLLLQSNIKQNEGMYRNFQTFFKDLDYLDQTQVKNARVIVSVLDSIPSNVRMENFSFNQNRVSSSFTANSLDDITKYETFLKQTPEYSGVRINLEKIDDETYEFGVNYIIGRDEI